jgi:F-type H+-transporting ATPase subunit gamma
MRLRIRSVENIAQVTRALQAVSASRVRKAEARVKQTRPYADKAWQVLRHLSIQPAKEDVHPFLVAREPVKNVIAVIITGDRGLAGAYNTNVLRYTLEHFRNAATPVKFVVVGRKGRDILMRLHVEFLAGRADQVFLVYTDFVNLLQQIPRDKLLLPVSFDPLPIGENIAGDNEQTSEREGALPTYLYEPSQEALINQIVPRLTELQVFQAITESLASEHAARMVAMRNATDNAVELAGALRLEYNKARQQAITSDMLDIAGGAEALSNA